METKEYNNVLSHATCKLLSLMMDKEINSDNGFFVDLVITEGMYKFKPFAYEKNGQPYVVFVEDGLLNVKGGDYLNNILECRLWHKAFKKLLIYLNQHNV